MRSSWKVSRLCFLAALAGSSAAWADLAANQAVDAVGLGLDGSGIKIGVVEAGGAGSGIPQLGGFGNNPNMPVAGPAGGQNGRVTLFANAFYNPAPPAGTPGIGDHATMVNGVIIQNGGVGIASSSQVFSMASLSNFDQIQGAQAMLRSDNAGPNVSIMNFSFTYNTPPSGGNSTATAWQDWAALTNNAFTMHDKLFVDAGNESPAGTRFSPWDSYNGITVGATTGPNGAFLANYNLSNVTSDGRYKTDIVAPGGGTSFVPGNLGGGTVTMRSPVVVGGASDNFGNLSPNDGINSDPQFAGTSFAAPVVSGAAALLLQDAAATPVAVDHSALKALILNGASKKVGAAAANDWQPVGIIGVKGAANDPVRIGWDQLLGTGLLDVGKSKINLDAGKQVPGPVNNIGWDYNSIATAGNFNSYNIQDLVHGYKSITATIAWDRRDQITEADNDKLWQPGETFTAPGLNDLDLKLYDITTNQLVWYSSSAKDSIEHVYYTVPLAQAYDKFTVQVLYYATNDNVVPATPYGVAWATTDVPEPTGLLIMGVGSILLVVRRRRA